MTKNNIKKLAEFFYSSNNANDVPIRLSIITGQYTGFDLSKDSFIELFNLLNNSDDLKNDLINFREKYE